MTLLKKDIPGVLKMQEKKSVILEDQIRTGT